MDPLARGLAIAGIVIALASPMLGWYLWHRSGPGLRVSAFVSAQTGTVRITVTCSGRMATTVRTIELRDWAVVSGNQTNNTVVSRWVLAVPADPNDPTSSVELAPTAYLEADVEVQKIIDNSAGIPEVTVWARVQRGDGKWYATKPFRVR
jgi:hypothetical protein